MIHKAAFIGSGLIGAGLAVNCAVYGVEAVLQTRRQIDRAKALVDTALDTLLENGVISATEKDAAAARCRYTTSIEEAVAGADFIQESGPEKMSVKQALIAEIEKYARPETVIASSTSGLSVTEVFSQAAHPERGVVGHPYNPAYLLPLIEIVRGEKSSDRAVEDAKAFYRSIGKEPVVLNREFPGFIANRFQWAIHREAVELVSKGVCSVEDADKALVYSVGMRWGLIGQYLTLHLGVSPEGIGKFNEKYHIDPSLPDDGLMELASWTTFPEDWCEMAQKGIDEELAHRPPEMGRDIASIEAWRDRMLIAYLKLHNKL